MDVKHTVVYDHPYLADVVGLDASSVPPNSIPLSEKSWSAYNDSRKAYGDNDGNLDMWVCRIQSLLSRHLPLTVDIFRDIA